MRRFSYIISLPLAVLFVVFAIDNGAPMRISLWPLPWEASVPGFVALFLVLILGFVVGAVAAWLSGARTRKRARDLADTVRAQTHQIAEQERRHVAQRSEQATTVNPPIGSLPPPR